MEAEALKRLILAAFADTPRPDDTDLKNSIEGNEPFLLEEEFRGKDDWRRLEPSFIDQAPAGFGSALSFFSPAAFRYYLPAYLIAEIDGKLGRAQPTFHLWHGLDDKTRGEKVNPRRFGDWTWSEAVRERFAEFDKGEIEAIVAYLEYAAVHDEFSRAEIDQAVRNYWVPRLVPQGQRQPNDGV
jgi:hypothetical protein